MNLFKAGKFALIAHGNQKRKYTGEPYINHCVEVAGIVASVTKDEDVIIAAILHDTVEDTKVEFEDIHREFGGKVVLLVEEVTDVSKPEDGNRKVRKEIDRIHLSKASPDGKTIKLADLINNTETITKYDENFAKTYMKEKKELLKVLVEGNSELWLRAKKIVDDYYLTHEEE